MEHEIFNHRHYRDFTIIPNEILQATDIPIYTLGLLCHLLSLPGSWVVNVGALSRRFGDSETKILRALKELIELGYCKRTPKYEGGKLCGQRYQITDIRNDFSDPSIFRGTENNSAPIEIADSAKNVGTDKINNNNINTQEEKEKARDARLNKPHLFIDSCIAQFDDFVEALKSDPNYAGADLRYYYEVIKNWSNSNGNKKKDWIATAKNWLLREYKEGKLVREKPQGADVLSEGAKRFLERNMALDSDELWPGL